MELLTLFTDKGVAIQNAAISNVHLKTDDMVEQLASLILPIDALLAHSNFTPQLDTSSALIALFRNMWFICILFHFTMVEEVQENAMEWQRPALARIATKTPSMVLEEASEFIANELEYCSVLRKEYAHTVSIKLAGLSCYGSLIPFR